LPFLYKGIPGRALHGTLPREAAEALPGRRSGWVAHASRVLATVFHRRKLS